VSERIAVPLPKAYLLLNHGPTVLVSSAHGDKRNVMAAAWNMALDFDPPKVAVVIDKSTLTRELVEASGEFVLNVPAREQAALTLAAAAKAGVTATRLQKSALTPRRPAASVRR
jgi:flavin reductase (DIM6/NTAB) family NADH-FMN oxidoreductase RutF